MNTSTKIAIFLIVLSAVSFIYFRDRYEEPIPITAEDKTVSLGCSDGYIMKENLKDPKLTCFKEAGFGHIKYTFLLALSLVLWTGVGIMFFLDYKMKDESSVLQFLQDDYQTENKPIPKCPDISREKGFTWTFKGYDKVFTSTEPVLFVSKDNMVKFVSKNMLFWGRRTEISALELYHYIGKDARLFKSMTGADAKGYVSDKLVRKEEAVPTIYIPVAMKYEEQKSYFSLKGGFRMGADRFRVILPMLYQIKQSILYLDPHMDRIFKGMMLKGEQYVASTARTGMEADKTRRTDSTESSRMQPNNNSYDQQRREM